MWWSIVDVDCFQTSPCQNLMLTNCETCRDASSKYISLRLESRNSVLTCSRKIIPSVSIYQPPPPIPSVRKSARMFIETHMCEKFFNFSSQMFQKQTSVDWLAGGFKYITFNFSPPPKIEVRWVKPSKSSTIDGPAAYFSVDSWWFSDRHPPVKDRWLPRRIWNPCSACYDWTIPAFVLSFFGTVDVGVGIL